MYRSELLYNCEILEKTITWNHYILDNSYYEDPEYKIIDRSFGIIIFDVPANNIFSKPYFGNTYITKNFHKTYKEQKEILIQIISQNQFIEILPDDQILVENLFFEKPPLTLSHTIHDPVKMSKLIKHITTKCKDLHPMKEIEHLHLNRLDEPIEENSNNPNDPITLQIAKTANAKHLSGKAGSNTHLSIFAKNVTTTDWIPRKDPEQTDRNQLICDLQKTYNT